MRRLSPSLRCRIINPDWLVSSLVVDNKPIKSPLSLGSCFYSPNELRFAQLSLPITSCYNVFMNELQIMPRTALKYESEVQENGLVSLYLPLLPGVKVTVFVIEEPDNAFSDLILASETSLDFWDNPFDNEDWNNA